MGEMRESLRGIIRVKACVLLSLGALFVDHSSLLRAQEDDEKIRRAVVKVTASQRLPDFMRPWNRMNPKEISGSGFLIDGGRIITNAHVILFGSQVYVQPDKSDEKLPVRVEAFSPRMDLAVLRLEDPEALGDREPLQIDESLPKPRSDVNVYGYPIGGDQLSITKGIVSRVELASYSIKLSFGLRTQIDAAINPGNSGGPAIHNGQVVGVAFSGVRAADNIGYLIPGREVAHFLNDAEDGKVDGKPGLWEYFQTVENPVLRTQLGLPKNVGGLMISHIRDPHPDQLLRVGDVLIRVGPYAIDAQGNVVDPSGLVLGCRYYFSELAVDGKLPLTIFRDGQEISLEVPVTSRPRELIPALDGKYPRYFIFGPLTFEAVSADLAIVLAADARLVNMMMSRASPLVRDLDGIPTEECEELVVVPAVPFAHKSMKGYSPPLASVVHSVNGVRVRSLRHLAEMLRDSQDEYLRFQFAERGAEILVFRRQDLVDATEDVLVDNNIRTQYSEDLAPIWKAAAASP